MLRFKRKTFSVAAAALLSLSLLAGCTGEGSENKEVQKEVQKETGGSNGKTASAEKKDTIIVVAGNEPEKLSTFDQNTTASDYINRMNYNGLFKRVDINGPQPDLVDTYEPVSDTEWVMKLKPNVKFHDGTILTAEDVKATLEFTKKFPQCQQITESVESVEVIDDLTFKLTTVKPHARLLDDLSHHANFILPKHLIEADHDFNNAPVGTGPYKHVKWTVGEQIELEMFDEYFDEADQPSIKNIIWRIVPEATSRAIALEAGEADMIIDLSANDIPRLKELDGIEVSNEAGTEYNMLLLNNDKEPFDNVLVRRGINAAIDKEAVVIVAMDGLADPSYAQTPQIFPETTMENTDTYDVEKALAYFEEAGVDPKTIKFEILVVNDENKRAAEVIQANLLEIGITVSISSIDHTTALQKEFEGDYEAAIGKFTTSSNLMYVSSLLHSNLIGASNRTQLNDPKVDRLIDAANQTIDDEKRNEVLNELIVYLNDITTHIPLYQNSIRRAYSADLEGYNVTPFGSFSIQKFKWK